MVHGLAGVRTGIKDNAIAGLGNTLGQRNLVRLAGDFGQQPSIRLGEARKVRIVSFRNDKHVNWSLRIDVTECKGAFRFEHLCRRHLTSSYLAEQAVSHGPDTNV